MSRIDTQLRQLERAAQEGGRDELERLVQFRVTHGLLDAGWLMAAGPMALSFLPPELIQGLLRPLVLATTAGPGNVFADWRDNKKCPRGHRQGDLYLVASNNYQATTHFRAIGVAEGSVFNSTVDSDGYVLIESGREDQWDLVDDMPMCMSCSQCNALWPLTPGDWDWD